ncbi:MAG: EFR1 family ferrodoxin [Sphaerochaetaceae bacterium]|nr:EFR1 family ferrodoxin [Sphaerochaetaceae bacterium]
MNGGIFYFSGAGNSEAVARKIAHETSIELCLRMADAEEERMKGIKTLGLVFPAYYGVPPAYLIHFIHDVLAPLALELDYLFIVITHGGGPAYTAAVTEMLLQDAGYAASYTAGVRMVDTYIPLFRVPNRTKQDVINRNAYDKVKSIASEIREQKIRVSIRWPLSRTAYRVFLRIHGLRYDKDRTFTVDQRCTRCGLCVRVCPVGNISLTDTSITYHSACERCFACYHHCPTHAITLTHRPLHGYQYYPGPVYFKKLSGENS